MKNASPRKLKPIGSFSLTGQQAANFFFLVFLCLCSYCVTPAQPTQKEPVYQRGSVQLSRNTLPGCGFANGLAQKEIRRVHSDAELIAHYGLSFWIRFRDSISPSLYGALYYQNPTSNLYCMALPNGYFASFVDQKVDRRSNIIQEVCHPIQHCPLLKESRRQTPLAPAPRTESGMLP